MSVIFKLDEALGKLESIKILAALVQDGTNNPRFPMELVYRRRTVARPYVELTNPTVRAISKDWYRGMLTNLKTVSVKAASQVQLLWIDGAVANAAVITAPEVL